jgi:STE24 endopeptidase
VAGAWTTSNRAGSARPTPWRAFPANPADWFSPEEIAKAKRYQRPIARVTAVDGALRLALILALVGLRAPTHVLDAIGLHGWMARLCGVGALVGAFSAVTLLPAAAWRQLVYDRRWGFSTQTGRGLVLDSLKELAVIAVLFTAIGLPTWAVVRATSRWALYAWVIFALLSVAIGVLYPVVVAPLFNRYTSMADGPLRAALLDVAGQVDADLSDVLVEDSSRRTTKGNAYVTGLGRTRRVVVYDTLVDHPPAELRTVVAHEIGHWKLRHVPKSVAATLVLSSVTFALLGIVLPSHPVLRFAHLHRLGDPEGFVLFLVGFPLAARATGLVQSWLSRSFEREADLFALRTTGDTTNFMAAMRSLHTGNLNDLAPSWWKRLNATHPPASERLAMGAAVAVSAGAAGSG